MVGDDYTIDTRDGCRHRSAASTHGGDDTGVDIEIRSGGAAIGLPDRDVAVMYQPTTLLLGYVYTDEAIQNSGDFPTVADRCRACEKNPQMIMWDPATYPDVKAHRRPRQGRASRSATSAARPTWTTSPSSGILSQDQVDGSYDGTRRYSSPTRASRRPAGLRLGRAVHLRERDPRMGTKPVEYQYINDAGWKNYAESIATKPENIETYTDCFAAARADHPAVERRLPQRSGRDQRDHPRRRRRVRQRSGCTPQGVADYAVETMKNDGLVANGPDETHRQVRPRPGQRPDRDRRAGLHRLGRQDPRPALTADDIVTNEFIDASIGLPATATDGQAASTDAASESPRARRRRSERRRSDDAVRTTVASDDDGGTAPDHRPGPPRSDRRPSVTGATLRRRDMTATLATATLFALDADTTLGSMS